MELGDRIKQARLAAGLSQRQLCGDRVTRNMLSLIESGKARPSMDTLDYFAQQLGKPLSYFLGEDTPVRSTLLQAEQALCAKDPSTALQLCLQDPSPTQATAWLTGSCYAALAQQALAQGRTGYAMTLIRQAQQAVAGSVYAQGADELRLALLGYAAAPQQAQQWAAALPELTDVLLVKAHGALLDGDGQKAQALLTAADSKPALWHYLWGRSCMVLAQYAQAKEALEAVEKDFPDCLQLLEICCRELGDFKGAYAYACRQRTEPRP